LPSASASAPPGLERSALGQDGPLRADAAPRLALSNAVGAVPGVDARAAQSTSTVSGRLAHVHGGAVLRLGTSF
jgi:hypothetical protein